MVSYIQSVYWEFGSGVVLADGRTMVYGNVGGDGQPQSQAAVFSCFAMFGDDLQQAVTKPRWLLGRTWGTMSVSLKVESRLDPGVIAGAADPCSDGTIAGW